MPLAPLPFVVAAALLLAGCQAKVSHPTKTLAEQQVDIQGCTSAANDKYWMDPIAALLNAYDCLEAKGYQRGNADVSARVEQAVKNGRPVPAPGAPPQPCRVPCKAPPR
jgi:hypothetical protein